MELVVIAGVYVAFAWWLVRLLRRRRREQRSRQAWYEAQLRRERMRAPFGHGDHDGPYSGPQAA